VNKSVSPVLVRENLARLEPVIELRFPVRGSTIPSDHNYALFAGLVHLQAAIREQHDLSILSIPGFGDKQGKILLNKDSCMRIRIPVSKIPVVYGLAGKSMKLGVHPIQLGIPEILPLTFAETLRARIVTIKGYCEPDSFIEAANRQLSNLEIGGKLTIPLDRKGNPLRKTIKIKRFTVVGFTTEVAELSSEDSLKLQEVGLGGKRHMGCGYFLPYQGGQYV
jgi:CRISPR-associated protein Cas6